MIATLLLALIFVQDPNKPPGKTVEERLKELADKVDALDKKAAALTDENAKLQQKLDEAKNRRVAIARQSGAGWVKRYASTVQFTEKQSAELEELWVAWTKEDFDTPYDAARWKAREEALRSKLTPEQASRLGKKVAEDHEQSVKKMVTVFAQMAKLPAEKTAALEKAAGARLTSDETMLLLQAHPDQANLYVQAGKAVESSLPDLASTLTEEEQSALRTWLNAYLPKKR